MSKFSKSIYNYEKFYQQVPIWQQVEYLQAQVSKYVADNKNIKEKQVKKGIIGLCKDMSVDEYCDILKREFGRMFDNVVVGNSVRVNFKQDLLNGIFLLHVNKILQKIQHIPTITQHQNTSPNPSTLQNKLYFTQIQQITTRFNQYRTFKKQKLKQSFYHQFQGIQNIMYDLQQNDDQFVNLDQSYIDSDEEQEREGKNGCGVDGNKRQLLSGLFEEIDVIEQDLREQLQHKLIIDV